MGTIGSTARGWGIGLLMLALSAGPPAAAQDFMTPSGGTINNAAPATPRIVSAPLVDPDRGSIFFLPAARTLPRGKIALALARPVGVGIYYGATPCLTLGVGVAPVAVELEIKWSVIKLLRNTISLWGFFHVPLIIKMYAGEMDEAFADAGFMYGGGILYAYEGFHFEFRAGILAFGFPMVDKFKRCSGDDCSSNSNWYHRYVMTLPYVEAGARVAARLKVFFLATGAQVRSVTIDKTVVVGSVVTRERKSFFWEDLILSVGLRYFRKRFALDVGIVVPIVPSKWGGEGYPYAFPMAGATWVF